MVNHPLGNVKTTINVDEDTLMEFKKLVTNRYGSTRKLSLAIDEAMKNLSTTSILVSYAKKEGIPLRDYPSSREIRARRPVVDSSAGEEVRVMRDERAGSVSGQQ